MSAVGRRVLPFVVRGVVGAPRRAAILVGLSALCAATVVMQFHAAAGVQRSINGAFLGVDERTVVVAAAQPSVDPVTVGSLQRASRAARRLPGVAAAGTALTFTAPLAGAHSSSPAQVMWAEPAYQRLVAESGSRVRAATDGGGALVPAAVASAVGVRRDESLSVGRDTVTDLGPPAASFKDPSLQSTVVVAPGVGPGPPIAGGTIQLAVLCRSRPSARLLALLRLVVGADAPSQTAVVSEGAPPAAASRVEGLTGSAGRAGVLVAALGGMAIVLILQSGTVHRRRAEIAVRRSLGASRAEVGVAMALEAVVLGAIGGVLGAALGGAVLLDLVGLHVVAPVPLTGLELLAVGLVTGGLAGVAALVPAIRAARTDPADVLRSLGDG